MARIPRPTPSLALCLVSCLAAPAAAQPAPAPPAGPRIELTLLERDRATGEPRESREVVEAARVGVVAVDVWNWHWCKTATMRVDALVPRIEEAVGLVAGTPAFVELVERFKLVSQVPGLVAVARAPDATEQVAATATRVALSLDAAAVRAAVLAADPQTAPRLLTAVGIAGTPQAIEMLEGLLPPADVRADLRSAAVLALARSQRGAERLVALAKEGRLVGPLAQTAAAGIATCPWQPVKAAAAGVLPLPQPKGGGSLPPIEQLVKQRGDAARGKALFAGAGTCAKCHVVGGEGKAVGPDLSGIGTKLSRITLFESILAPSAAISHNFETHTGVLKDGRSVTGLLVSKSPDEVIVRGADGIDVKLAAAEIEELVTQPVSLMPADLAATLSVQELVDVVAWLETLRGQPAP